MSDNGSSKIDDTARLLAEYGQTALEWDGAANDSRKANRLFERNHNLYKTLRGRTEGRQGIAALMLDPNPGVRLLAATHSLAWTPDEACAVLEALEQGVGLHAVSAKYTLQSYRSGSLNLDW